MTLDFGLVTWDIPGTGGSETGTDAVRWFFYQNFRVFSKLWRVYVLRTDSLRVGSRVPVPSPFTLCCYHHCCCCCLCRAIPTSRVRRCGTQSARREKLARSRHGTREERWVCRLLFVCLRSRSCMHECVRAGAWILMWIIHKRHFFLAFKSWLFFKFKGPER